MNPLLSRPQGPGRLPLCTHACQKRPIKGKRDLYSDIGLPVRVGFPKGYDAGDDVGAQQKARNN